jgi:MSHA biogenesis protein MshP
MFLSVIENKKNISNNSKQQGLGLPMALFIITIMSLIAAAINQLGEVSSQSYTQNLLSVRAFYAAESGAQLRAQAVLSSNPCSCGALEAVTYNFSAEGLNQCSATTSCTSFIANSETFCTLVIIGRCDKTNAERTLEVRLK